MRGPDYPQGPQAEWHGPPGPAKPTAIEISACAERLIADSERLPPSRRDPAQILSVRAQCHMPDHVDVAFELALRAMRYNPRAFALAGLIGQHCG